MPKQVIAFVVCVTVWFGSWADAASGAENPSRQQSQPQTPTPFALPIVKRDSLLNGLQLLVLEQPGGDNLKFHLRINSGGVFDLAGKGGLADVTAGMLLRGGGGLSATSLSNMVEQLGLTLRVSVNWDSTDVEIGGPKAEVDSLFDLLSRLVIAPAFEQKELDALKAQRIQSAKQEATDEAGRIRQKALAAVYGSHPYGRPLTGTPDSLQQITRADIVAFHSRFYQANNAELLVEGDVTAEQVTRLARARLGMWKKGEVVPPNFRQPERLTAARVLVVDRADATAGHANLAMIGVSRRADDYFASMMAVDVFNQLLAQANLGATARADARLLSGPLTIETSGPVGQIAEQVKKITSVMARMQAQGPTLEQVEAAKSRMIAAMGERLRNNVATADLMLDVESYGLGRDYVLRYAERVNAVTPADIQAAARALLRPEAMAIVLSGPAGQLESDAKQLGSVTIIR